MRTCTRDQIRELDRRAIQDYGIPGVVLMENAGRGAAGVAVEMLCAAEGKLVAIFCGKGNNGGDGFVIARHLHNLGARARLVLAFDPEKAGPETDWGINFAIARNMRLPFIIAESRAGQDDAALLARGSDLIVDALLGTGLSGEVREPYMALIRLINAADKPVLAVDIPSGLDADTGQVLRAAVRATRTATFVMPKAGFFLTDGPAHIGRLHIIDIGVPKELVESTGTIQ